MNVIGTELPQNIIKPNVERTILSICLQKPERIIDVKGKEIKGDMFLIDANKYIFYAIDYLFGKKQTPTPIVVLEVLKDRTARKAVEDFGGIEYLTILSEQRINESDLDILCDKLKQSYTRKKLYEICEESKSKLFSDKAETLNPSEIIQLIEEPLQELNTDVQQIGDIYKMGTDAEEILTMRAENPNSIPGLEVGWEKTDYFTNGGQPGDLIMVCARAKTGKSTLLTNWAVNLSIKDKIPILYFDTEMSSREQEDRILSIISGIPHKEIVSGMYVMDTEVGTADEKIPRVKEAVKQIQEGKYFHIYLPTFTIEKVESIARKFKAQEDIQAIFFDYLKFPASQLKSLKNAAEWQMLGFIASGLKDLAGNLKVPIWSACQENRTNLSAEKKSELNVGGSDRILQLATKLMFLSNKSDEELLRLGESNGNQTLYIAYQRNGQSDVPPINIQFNRTMCTQKEV